MTSSSKAVRSVVFSIRFVVASMSAKAFARAAYGTLQIKLNNEIYEK